MKFRLIWNLVLVALISLAGCASPQKPPPLTPEEENSTAAIYFQWTENEVRQGLLWNIDKGFDHRENVGVYYRDRLKPGVYQTYGWTYRGPTLADTNEYHFKFSVQPGLGYIIKNRSTIDVFKRGNNTLVDTLTRGSNDFFISSKEVQQISDENATKRRQEAAALVERRTLNLAQVRKIGARICQTRNNSFVYVGYVESLTTDKVQIRISDAQMIGNPSIRPGGFTQSIIWDSPLNWDLCE